jgi:integrase
VRLRSGSDEIVSEMLGHSTVAIALDVYSHVTPAMHREAAAVMDELLYH